MFKKDTLAINKLRERLNIAENSSIKSIILFGSKVRGGDKKGSDIDILAIVKNRRKAENLIYEIASDILSKYYVDLSVITFSESEYKKCYKKGSLFLREVEKEGRVIWSQS